MELLIEAPITKEDKPMTRAQQMSNEWDRLVEKSKTVKLNSDERSTLKELQKLMPLWKF